MKTASLTILTFSAAVLSCGGHHSSGSSQQQEQSPPISQPSTPLNFTETCRKANAVTGSNFQFEWVTPTAGQVDRLRFDTSKNIVRLYSTATTTRTVDAGYTPVKPASGTVGSQGSLNYQSVSLQFPVIPFGTVTGSTQEYAIGNLTANGGSTDLGTYLCTKGLLNELR